MNRPGWAGTAWRALDQSWKSPSRWSCLPPPSHQPSPPPPPWAGTWQLGIEAWFCLKQSLASEVSYALKYKRNGIGKITFWNLCPFSLRLMEDLEELLAQVEPATFCLLDYCLVNIYFFCFLPPYSNRKIVITLQLVSFLDTTFFKVVSELQMQHFSGGLAIIFIKNLIIIPISASSYLYGVLQRCKCLLPLIRSTRPSSKVGAAAKKVLLSYSFPYSCNMTTFWNMEFMLMKILYLQSKPRLS